MSRRERRAGIAILRVIYPWVSPGFRLVFRLVQCTSKTIRLNQPGGATATSGAYCRIRSHAKNKKSVQKGGCLRSGVKSSTGSAAAANGDDQ